MSLDEKRLLKVFLCHASGDKPPVRDLYRRLAAQGVDAWLDQEKLLPGQDWRMEIPRAVQESDVVVVCLSNKSITKEGYIQKEIKFALDVAEEKPDGAIFLIPARLEDCPVPERLSRWQWVDLFEENGFIRLLRSLKLRAAAVGAVIEAISYEDTDQDRLRRIDQLYTEGLAAFYTEDWERACRRFQAILSEQPNHRNAAEKLEEAKCQRDYAGLYSKASEAYQSEDWHAALQALEELSQKAPEYKDTAQLLRDVRKREQLAELYTEAKALHTAQKWKAVIKVFEQIAILEPNYPDADGLLATAHKEVVELERLTRLNDQYGRALREMDSGHWHEARGLLETIHKSQIGFLDTERLLRKVETEIQKIEEVNRRTIQVQTLYKQAHEFIRSKNWRKALEKMEEVRKLDDQFADAEGIFGKARIELEREEQEALRQRKLNELYAEAVSLLQARKYQEALEAWNVIQAEDPTYRDVSRVRTLAKRKLDQLSRPDIQGRGWLKILADRFTPLAGVTQDPMRLAGEMLVFAFAGIAIINAVYAPLQSVLRISEWGGVARFLTYMILGGSYGLVAAITFIKTIPNWLRGHSLMVIAGWGLAQSVPWLVRTAFNVDFITLYALLAGLSVVVAIKWARPATRPVTLLLIFAGWILSWKGGALLGNHLQNLSVPFPWIFADPLSVLLGLMLTFGLLSERAGRIFQTALLGAGGFAAGNYLAYAVGTLISLPAEIIFAGWGLIGGVVLEASSRDIRRIMITGILCSLGLLVGSYIGYRLLPAAGLLYANRVYAEQSLTMIQPFLGMSLGLALGLKDQRAPAMLLLAVLGAGMYSMTRALNIELFNVSTSLESIVRGGLIGAVVGFGYDFLQGPKSSDGRLQTLKITRGGMLILGLWAVTITILVWQSLSPPFTSHRWDFDHSTEGWKNYNDLGYIQTQNGALLIRLTGLDPSFEFPDSLSIPASKTPIITVRMSIPPGEGTIGEIFFLTDQNPNWSASRSVEFNLGQDGTYQTYNIYMAEDPSWRGTVTGIRLDPVGDPMKENVQIAIDYISVHAP